MLIEIPDEYLEPIRSMPAISQNDKYKWIKDGAVLSWIGMSGELHIPIVMFRRAIVRRAKELGLIEYNHENKTWKGIKS